MAENAAQIFRNALLHSQETNSKHFLSVTQLCVKERKLTALSVLTQVRVITVILDDVSQSHDLFNFIHLYSHLFTSGPFYSILFPVQ